MLARTVVRQTLRTFGTSSTTKAAARQVLVSQSHSWLDNLALEDWLSRHTNLAQKNVLVLSHNQPGPSGHETVVATFLERDVEHEAEHKELLVCSSVPQALLMTSLPKRTTSGDEGTRSLSIQVELANGEITEQTVCNFMHQIGVKFLSNKEGRTDRLSLVRPDDGWFPGLSELRRDIEMVVELSKLNQKARSGKTPPPPPPPPSTPHPSSKSNRGRYKRMDSFGL